MLETGGAHVLANTHQPRCGLDRIADRRCRLGASTDTARTETPHTDHDFRKRSRVSPGRLARPHTCGTFPHAGRWAMGHCPSEILSCFCGNLTETPSGGVRKCSWLMEDDDEKRSSRRNGR